MVTAGRTPLLLCVPAPPAALPNAPVAAEELLLALGTKPPKFAPVPLELVVDCVPLVALSTED